MKNIGNILAISIILLFLILGLIRLYPFNNTLETVLKQTGDDWCQYAKSGLDIARNGIFMEGIHKPYGRPSGFLYCYFVAFCFFIFGENTVPIYLIQHLMMGLSIAIMYWTFKNKMKNSTGIMFLAGLLFFTFLDFYKYYAMRLLSENLMRFIIPFFFYCFMRGFEKDNIMLQVGSAFLLGIAVLTRANVIVFSAAIVFFVATIYLKKRLRGAIYLLIFIAVLGSTISFLGVRNYVVSNELKFLPDEGPKGDLSTVIPKYIDLSRIESDKPYIWITKANRSLSMCLAYLHQKPILFFKNYLIKRTLFVFGFTPLLVPDYTLRPHWILAWIGYFLYLFLRFREKKKMAAWEIAVNLYIFCYYGTVILVATIDNYGYRMLTPAINFVLLGAFLAYDKLRHEKNSIN